METAQQQAESIILEHTERLEALTAELLKKEVLSGEEIDAILNGELSGRRSQSAKPAPDLAARNLPRQGSDSSRQGSDSSRRGNRQQQPQPERVQRNVPKAVAPVVDPVVPAAKDEPVPEPEVESPDKVETDEVVVTGEAAPSRSSRRRRGSRSRGRKQGQGERTGEQKDAGAGENAPDAVPEASAEPQTRSRRRESGKASQAEEKAPEDRVEKAASSSSDSGNDDKKPKDGGSPDKRKGSVFRSRRTRMISLKTGGRRRVIQKAPAQKIREIN